MRNNKIRSHDSPYYGSPYPKAVDEDKQEIIDE